jgi:hypothetical protein
VTVVEAERVSIGDAPAAVRRTTSGAPAPAIGADCTRRRATGATEPVGDAAILGAARDPVMDRNTTGPRDASAWPTREPKDAPEPAAARGVRSCDRSPPCWATAPSAKLRRIGRNADAAPTGADAIRRPDAGVTGLSVAGDAVMARRSTRPRGDASDDSSDARAWSLGITESDCADSAAVAGTRSPPKNLRMTAPGPG